MEPNSEFRLHDNQVNRIQMNHICEEKDKIYSKKDPVIIKKILYLENQKQSTMYKIYKLYKNGRSQQEVKKNTLSSKPETKHKVQNI